MPELTGLPAEGPATLPAVKVQLRVKDAADDDRLAPIVAAVNTLVRSWPVSAAAVGAPAWPADIVLGANMLAARLWRRKDSPAGVEVFAADGAAYVMRNDPDIAMTLKLGSWSRPQLG